MRRGLRLATMTEDQGGRQLIYLDNIIMLMEFEISRRLWSLVDFGGALEDLQKVACGSVIVHGDYFQFLSRH